MKSGWAFLCGVSYYEEKFGETSFASYDCLDRYVIRLIDVLAKKESGYNKERIFAFVSKPEKYGESASKSNEKYFYKGIELRKPRRNEIIYSFSQFLKLFEDNGGIKDDTILVYFIGHGGTFSGESVVFSMDSFYDETDNNILLETSIPIKLLENQFLSKKSEFSDTTKLIDANIFFIIDACRQLDIVPLTENGEFQRTTSTDESREENNQINGLGIESKTILDSYQLETAERNQAQFLDSPGIDDSEPSGISTLFSCATGQKAEIKHKDQDNEYSLFSESLLEILGDSDIYPLKFGQVATYTSIDVQNSSSNQAPTPIISLNGNNKEVIGFSSIVASPNQEEIDYLRKIIEKNPEKWKKNELKLFVKFFMNKEVTSILQFGKFTSSSRVVILETILKNLDEETRKKVLLLLGNDLSSLGMIQSAGIAYKHSGNIDAWELTLEKLSDKEKKDPLLPSAWYKLGIECIYQDDPKKHKIAFKAFKKVLELELDHSDAFNNLGEIYQYIFENLEDAEECYRNAIKFQSNHSVAWYNLGNILSIQNLRKEAKNAFDVATKINERVIPAWINYGTLLAEEGKEEIAISKFESAIYHADSQFTVLPATPNYDLEYYVALSYYNLALMNKGGKRKKYINRLNEVLNQVDKQDYHEQLLFKSKQL